MCDFVYELFWHLFCIYFVTFFNDCLVFLRFVELLSCKSFQKWCKENGLLFKNLLFVQKIRKQLREEAKNSELKFASCGADRRKLR